MRRRNMYYATGLPGWMRFGYSPGRAGRGGGPGPCAQYLMTGQWPTPNVAGAPEVLGAPQQRLAFLQAQANLLEQQLQALREQIAGLDEQ